MSSSEDLSQSKTSSTPPSSSITTRLPDPAVTVVDGKAYAARASASEPSPHLLKKTRTAAVITAALVLFVAVLGLIGWSFDIQQLKHPIDEPSLEPPSTINFIAIGLSMLLFFIEPASLESINAARFINLIGGGLSRLLSVLPRIAIGRVIGIIVAVGGLVAFIEHTCELQCHLNLISPPEGLPVTFPGPLIPHGAFCFILMGIGVAVYNIALKKDYLLSQLFALLTFVPMLVVLFCYVLGQTHVCIFFGCVQLSPITAFLFVASAYALLFAQPDKGIARLFCLNNTVGKLARTSMGVLGLAFLIALPRGFLIEEATHMYTGLFPSEKPEVLAGEATQSVDIALMILAIFAACGAVWWMFRTVEREHDEKAHVIAEKEQELVQMQQKMDATISDSRRFKLLCLQCMTEFPDQDGTVVNCPNDQSELIRILENIKAGTIFNDRYRIERELGSGGMSTVYLAFHLLMNKDVAVKVLQTQFASDPKTIQRFQREAQASFSLSHPNLVAVYDFNVSPEGQAYMVMEFLQGLSLSQVIENKPLPWREAIEIFVQILDGVDHAHKKGILHRDLKPGNVMLVPSEVPGQMFQCKIVDFGFAKVSDDVQQQLTRTGEVFGSPLYMSPEQCRGQTMDQRSDMYAIGCIMYACLTGKPPFQGASIMETLAMQLNTAPPSISNTLAVPPWLKEVVYKAMAKDPDIRYQSATHLKEMLLAGVEASKDLP